MSGTSCQCKICKDRIAKGEPESNPGAELAMALRRKAEETTGGKLDKKLAKPPVVMGAIQMFPRALMEIAKLSEHGRKKYDLKCFDPFVDMEGLDPFEVRTNALGRHLIKEVTDGDPVHITAVAWNALARLEWFLKEGWRDSQGIS